MKRMMNWLGGIVMALALMPLSGVAEEAPVTGERPPADAVRQLPDAEVSPRAQAARMRGKILYKRSQIRKLEQEACERKAELKAKMAELEQERRTQYVAADPKLQELYAELDALEAALAKLPVERGKRNQ